MHLSKTLYVDIQYRYKTNFSAPKPSDPTEVTKMDDCERYRMEVMRDLGKKIVEIQNGI